MRKMLGTYLLALSLGAGMMLGFQSIWSHFSFCHQKYDLLNPLRRCGKALPQGEWNYEPLRNTLEAKKAELKTSGAVSHLSIYFQDLDHGPRFGIGEYEQFTPASLIKVPILIFFLHVTDLKPEILEKKISFTQALKAEDNVAPEETIHPNTPYTIRELLRKMIVYSDNRSYVLLLREMHALSEITAYSTFRDLDILKMMLVDDTSISISSYAKLFGVLYNTGYLSKDMSQFALQLLSETTFSEGITKGVPKGQRVAHKFGYRVVNGEGQLHDCGIVYHPKMAYTLCVMTAGADTNKGNEAIIEISRMVYEAVSAQEFQQLPEDEA